MALNLKQIAQEFCRRTALPVPNSIVGNNDARVAQVLGLLQEGLEDLTTRKRLQAVHRIAEFETVEGNDQGELETLAPWGFDSIIPLTMWDTTQNVAVPGSITPQEWEWQAVGLAGGQPFGQYRVLQGHLYLTDDYPEEHTIRFEYATKWYVQSGSTGKEYFTSDTDVFVLPERILLSWLRWRWKSEKGLPYAEEFRAYERHVATRELREAPTAPIDASLVWGHRFGIGMSGQPIGGGSSPAPDGTFAYALGTGAITIGTDGSILGI